MIISEEVKRALESRNMTQNELADRIGMTRQGLWKVLHRSPSLRTVEKIAKGIGCEVVEIMPVNPPFYHVYSTDGKWMGVLRS